MIPIPVKIWREKERERERERAKLLAQGGQAEQLANQGLSAERIRVGGKATNRLAIAIHQELLVIPRDVESSVVSLGMVLGDNKRLNGLRPIDIALVEYREGAHGKAHLMEQVCRFALARAGSLRAKLIAWNGKDVEP